MPFAVGDKVNIKVTQDDGSIERVPAVVSTVSTETPYGLTIEGDDTESTWYVDSELELADDSTDPQAGADASAARSDTSLAFADSYFGAKRGSATARAAFTRMSEANTPKPVADTRNAVGFVEQRLAAKRAAASRATRR